MAGAFLLAAGLGIYSLVQKNATPGEFHLEGALDDWMPFVPWMVFIYLGCFPYLVVSASRMGRVRFRRALLAMILVCLVSWTCFLLIPAAVTRPDPASIETGWLRWIFECLHRVDASHNSFPSLHVGSTWVCTFAFLGRRTAWLWFIAAILISLSTMLVEQHTVADVIGGVVLATLGWVASGRILGISRTRVANREQNSVG